MRKPAKKRSDESRRRAERRRLKKLLSTEASFWARGLGLVAGVDEAGRGPLAGPVVAAAVIMPPDIAIRRVDDSKNLSAPLREELALEIRAKAISFGIGAASAREIDRINILRATHLAITRAVGRLTPPPEHILVDGLPVKGLSIVHTAIIDGDALVHGIACASILAKVIRDRLMTRLARRYPEFGWDHNFGYGTAYHREALERLGPTPHHRRSFAPTQLLLPLA